jgi:hypothetical protein
MRANKIVNYESILQVLGEAGCPFCRFMKNFQAALLQDPTEKDIHHLCSFHTWGLAATQRAASAADVFLNLLAKQPDTHPASLCDVCVLLQIEEDRRVREFIGCAQQKLVVQWLRSQAVVCLIHGAKLKQGAPPVLASAISAVMERFRKELVEELTRLRDEYQPDTAKWGVLGQVAEFLVSQRGLHAWTRRRIC